MLILIVNYYVHPVIHFHSLYMNGRMKIIQLPLVIVDSSVILKMSTIARESTITREIHAKIDNRSTEHIHYNERFHYYEIHSTRGDCS